MIVLEVDSMTKPITEMTAFGRRFFLYEIPIHQTFPLKKT